MAASDTTGFSISNFQSTISSGVRPNLFKVRFNFPSVLGTDIPNGNNTTLLCKSAALPASTMGTIEVPFRGRNLKIPGDRTFDSWTATFINDGNFSVRNAFEQWMAKVNALSSNVGNLSPDQIFNNIDIFQLSKTSTPTSGTTSTSDLPVIRHYRLIGAWPSSVSQITLGYDQNDQIEEFDVEFQYQYFEIGTNDSDTFTIQ